MVTPDGRPGCPYAVLLAHTNYTIDLNPYITTVTIIDSIDHLGKTYLLTFLPMEGLNEGVG